MTDKIIDYLDIPYLSSDSEKYWLKDDISGYKDEAGVNTLISNHFTATVQPEIDTKLQSVITDTPDVITILTSEGETDRESAVNHKKMLGTTDGKNAQLFKIEVDDFGHITYKETTSVVQFEPVAEWDA